MGPRTFSIVQATLGGFLITTRSRNGLRRAQNGFEMAPEWLCSEANRRLESLNRRNGLVCIFWNSIVAEGLGETSKSSNRMSERGSGIFVLAFICVVPFVRSVRFPF